MIYEKHDAPNGDTWYVRVCKNRGDYVFVDHHRPDSQGFAGRTLEFPLEDDSTDRVKGPWHSNSHAFLTSTGVDYTAEHETQGWIAEERVYQKGASAWKTPEPAGEVFWKDDAPVIGRFDRLGEMALEIANREGRLVIVFSRSNGGSSCIRVKPEEVQP